MRTPCLLGFRLFEDGTRWEQRRAHQEVTQSGVRVGRRDGDHRCGTRRDGPPAGTGGLDPGGGPAPGPVPTMSGAGDPDEFGDGIARVEVSPPADTTTVVEPRRELTTPAAFTTATDHLRPDVAISSAAAFRDGAKREVRRARRRATTVRARASPPRAGARASLSLMRHDSRARGRARRAPLAPCERYRLCDDELSRHPRLPMSRD